MRTALVTGASRGIGRAAAVRLARDGFHVVVNYAENEVAASEVVSSIEREGGSAVAVRAALGTPGAVTALASELTSMDVLVNNAGVGLPKPLSEVTPEEYDRVFAVNVRELFFLTQRLLPLIPSGGRIINVTSGVTRISYPEGIAYAMTKGAVQTFTLALAKELGPRGITVNNVAPGIIDTDANASWLDEGGRAYAASRHAVNRVGEPHEIADAIGFLASPQASFITGTTIDATGGGNL
ncbi:SDR family NAD(P)-dependent oxidoreductase [Nonomuraea dietziae]|uniref:SDR family NAD(P)-dependent oxidoreductase n=1 Tax=Nonomuraea dietziae TaxID=65515 RepID=UPI003407E919